MHQGGRDTWRKGIVLKIRRVYDTPLRDDGVRILVDRLWPRGLSKTSASIDLWLKQIAPSNELRTWFAHDPARWREFKRRYFLELRGNPALSELSARKAHGSLTLLYAARDEKHNNAVALAEYLRRSFKM